MNLEDLEELLSDYLPSGFGIETNKKGEVIIYTGMRLDEEGELVDIKGDPLEDDEDTDFSGEEEFEPLEEDVEDEDE